MICLLPCTIIYVIVVITAIPYSNKVSHLVLNNITIY
jgi:hypothetical protein